MRRALFSFVASISLAAAIHGQEMAAPATGPAAQTSSASPGSLHPIRLEGTADATGALTRRVDIAVPPFHALEPRLALTYHSRLGDGPLGVGWSLAGISTIQRATPGKGIAAFDSSDVFLLDGELLHPCAVGSPSPGCRYPLALGAFDYFFTDIERYQRIGRDAATGNWTVWLQNGTRLQYSEPVPTPSGVARWLLTTVTDTSGNQVAYSYAPPVVGDERLLSTIAYGKSEVRFHYARRPYLLSYGIGGATIVSDAHRLVSIDQQTNGSRVRAYALDYVESATTGRSLLSAVQEFGTDAVLDTGGAVDKAASPSFMPPTKFTYKSDPDAPNAISLHSDAFPAADGHFVRFARDRGSARLTLRSESLAGNAARHVTVDLNGDGIPDHVIMTYDPSAASGDRTGAFATKFQAYISRPGSFKQLEPFSLGIVNPASPALQLQVVDVDGDHRQEIVVFEWHETPVRHYETVTLFFHPAAEIFTHSVTDRSLAGIAADLRVAGTMETRDGPFTNPIFWGAQLFAGDFNGDGHADLLLANIGTPDRRYTFHIALGRGDGSFMPPLPPWSTVQQASVGSRWLLTDLNGDGRSDLAFIGPDADDGSPTAPTAAAGSHVVVCGALSRTAFQAVFEGSPFVVQCQSTGIPAVTTEPSCGAIFQLPRDHFVVADVNGDGSRDIVRIGADLDVPNCHTVPFPRDVTYQTYQHILSNGDAGFTVGAEYAPRLAKGTFVLVADIEGDGREDLLALRSVLEGAACLAGTPPGTDCAVQAQVIQIRYKGLAASVDVQPDGRSATPGLVYPLGGFAFGGAGPVVSTLDTLEVGDFDGNGVAEISVWHRAYDNTRFLDDVGWNDERRTMLCGAPPCAFWDVLFHVRTWAPGAEPIDAQNWRSGDVDGDGHPDYVRPQLDGTNLTLFVRLRQPDGSFRALPPARFGVPFSFALDALMVADVNGDGRADLVHPRYEEPVAPGRPARLFIVTLLAAGGGLFTSSTWALDVARRMPEISHWRAADTNGDGKSDLVYLSTLQSPDQTCRRQAQLEVFRWSESFIIEQDSMRRLVSVWTAEPAAVVPACGALLNSPHWYVYDADRNGTQDFAGVWPGAPAASITYAAVTILSRKDGSFHSTSANVRSRFAHAPSRWTPIDINGDGLPELASVVTDISDAPTTRITADVLLSSGDRPVSLDHAFDGGAHFSSQSRNVAFMEWNGDGRTDLVRLWWDSRRNALSVLPLVSDGTDFVPAPTETVVNSLAYPDVRNVRALVTDGSHRDSLEYLGTGFPAPTITVRTSSRYAPPRLVADLLTKIDEPLGAQTSVDYSQMTRAAQTSDPVIGCRLPPSPGYLVSKVRVDPRGDAVSQSIAYNCPRYSAAERTLWAWQDIVRTESAIANRPSRSSSERWEADDRCGARLLGSRASGGGITREVTFTPRIPAPTAPYLCETVSVTVADTDASGSLTRTESFTYGELGGVEEHRELGDTLRIGDERTTHNTYEILADPFIVTPATSTVHAGLGRAGPVLLQSEYCYDGTVCSHRARNRGLLTAERRFYDVAGRFETLAQFDYDARGNLSGITDANGATTRITYETTLELFPELVVDALGHRTSIEWNLLHGRPAAIIDPNRVRQDIRAYDALGRLKTIATADGGLTSFEYRSWGLPAQSVRTTIADGSASGLWSETLFDGFGRTKRLRLKNTETGPAYILSFAYGDLSENPKEISHGALEGAVGIPAETLTYDVFERLASIKHPDGTSRTSSFLARGGNDVDELGHRREYTTDAYGNVTSITEGRSQTVAFDYDRLDRRIAVRDAADDAVVYHWDSLDRIIREDDPDLGKRTFTYDLAGNLTNVHDARGNDITLTFDAAGRPKTRAINGSTVVTWRYDEAGHANATGRLTSVLDARSGCAVARSLDYDIIGRVNVETRCRDGLSYTVGRQFDALNRLARFIYPSAVNKAPADGEAVTATFQPNGWPDALSGIVAASSHDPEGRFRSRTLRNRVTEVRDYDAVREWPKSDSFHLPAAPTVLSYRVNADGTMAAIAVAAPGRSVDHAYVVDDQHRLTRVDTTIAAMTTSEAFSYDAIGNLKTAGGDVYDYPAPGPGTTLIHAPQKIGPRTFTYDAAGNTTKVTNGATDEQRFEWDALGLLTAAEIWDGAAFRRTEFAYDADGRRIKVRTPDGKTFYDFFDEVEQDEAGRLVKRYFLGGDPVARRDGGGALTYLHRDIFGSIRLVTSDAGTAIDAFEYAPFGSILRGDIANAGGRGYIGHRHDLSTAIPGVTGSGLMSLGARAYDPLTRRFLSPDTVLPTLLTAGGLSRYAYAYNNPIDFIDPSGHGPENAISPGFGIGFGSDSRFQGLPPGLNAAVIHPKNYPVMFGVPKPPLRDIKIMIGTSIAAPILAAGVVYGGPYIAAAATSLGSGSWAAITTAARTGALSVMIRFPRLFGAASSIGAGMVGVPTAAQLTRLANAGGPTVRVVTNLTQAPAPGRALSTAAGEAAQALANAARSGSGTRTFVANIPKALIDGLEKAGLVRITTTMMNGVQSTEYRFFGAATEFILKFFQEVKPQ